MLIIFSLLFFLAFTFMFLVKEVAKKEQKIKEAIIAKSIMLICLYLSQLCLTMYVIKNIK